MGGPERGFDSMNIHPFKVGGLKLESDQMWEMNTEDKTTLEGQLKFTFAFYCYKMVCSVGNMIFHFKCSLNICISLMAKMWDQHFWCVCVCERERERERVCIRTKVWVFTVKSMCWVDTVHVQVLGLRLCPHQFSRGTTYTDIGAENPQLSKITHF